MHWWNWQSLLWDLEGLKEPRLDRLEYLKMPIEIAHWTLSKRLTCPGGCLGSDSYQRAQKSRHKTLNISKDNCAVRFGEGTGALNRRAKQSHLIMTWTCLDIVSGIVYGGSKALNVVVYCLILVYHGYDSGTGIIPKHHSNRMRGNSWCRFSNSEFGAWSSG